MKRLSFFLSAVMMLVFTGCYDDAAILDRLGKLEAAVNGLNSELDALHGMLDGTVTITECTQNSNGTYDVTLSSGVTLTVKDGADLSAAITYKTDREGNKCWALYSDDGEAMFITDDKGKNIPISQPVPTVRVDASGDRFLVVGDKEYPLGGESVFTSYKVNKNPLTGDVLSVTFGFGADMSFTVTVDGAHLFRFVEMDVDRPEELTSYFVAPSVTVSIRTEQVGVVGYNVEMPRGWDYERYTDEAGVKYLNVTAPSAEEIKNGALARGIISVIAVLEGGKAIPAELLVTTDPFASMDVLYDDMSIKMTKGLIRYMYGIMPKTSYTQEGALAKAAELINEPQSKGFAEQDKTEKLADVYGTELVPGDEYVLWAVPALWINEEFVVADFVRECEFTYITVELTVSEVQSYNDAQMTLALGGVTEWYGGVVKKEEGVMEKILSGINSGQTTDSYTEDSYAGSVFEFASCDLLSEAGETYIVWVLADNGNEKFQLEDIVSKEFTLNPIVSGGSLEIVASDADCQSDVVTVPLKSTGADRIYYAFVTYTNSSKYNTDELKVQYVLANGLFGVGESVDAVSTSLALKPENNVVLFAVSISADGKYGKVFSQTYKTSAIPFNDWTVTLENTINKPSDVRVKITVKDGDGVEVNPSDYLYWAGNGESSFWKNTLGRSVTSAQQYMWLNVGKDKNLKTDDYGEISDGVLILHDLPVEKTCHIVVMVKDTEGYYSKAALLSIETLAIDFGEIVWAEVDGQPNPKWEAMKPTASEESSSTIVWQPKKFVKAVGLRNGEAAFDFNCPAGYSAYVMYGTENYMIDDDDRTLYGRDRMILIARYVDSPRDGGRITGENEFGYITTNYHFVHGDPLYNGATVVFDHADMDEHKEHCSCASDYTGDSEVVVYFNNETVSFRAAAVGKEGLDKVYIMYVDSEGNFYEPYAIDIPYEYFKNAQAE